MHDVDSLVKACQSGDIKAFEELVRLYQDRTARLLYLLLGNIDDVQDVAQETFIKVFRCINGFRCGSSFTTWLHRITINTAHNWIRNNRRGKEIPVPPDERWRGHTDRPEECLMAKERTIEITWALSMLPRHYREAIILRHYEGLSYDEIAEIQQVPLGTVKSRLSKGRFILQRLLGNQQEASDTERNAENGL